MVTSIKPEKTHFKIISISGQTDVVADSESDTLTFVEGSNITLTTEDNSITISASGGGGGGSTNAFSTIAVDGLTDNIEADSSTGTLTFAAGEGISIANNASSDTITITSTVTDTNTTYAAGDGLDITGTTFSTDLKANGGIVTESSELAVDLGASSITGTLAISDGGTGSTTASAARGALGVDEAGTDNSTNVTLANTNYLSISGQELTGGTVPIGSGGTGATTASAARTALNLDTNSFVQFGSLAVGNTNSVSSGEIHAQNDIVAFSSSDKRLKTNIQSIQDPLTKLQKIGGYTFDWIPKEGIHSHEGRDVGVIAQEIEEVLPEVTTTRDNGYKAVKYEKIVPLLIECMKAQQTHIQQLEDRLVKLEKKD